MIIIIIISPQLHINTRILFFKSKSAKVQERLKGFELYIIDLVEEYQYDGQYGKWEYDWVFPKSLLYSVSLMSTIGKSNNTPSTTFKRSKKQINSRLLNQNN